MTRDTAPPPTAILVMGVSGSGKTTVGRALALDLGWIYADADDFHSQQNISSMRAGHPLTDVERAPWLAAIGDWIDARAADAQDAVVTCSALKRRYRDELRHGRPQVRLLYLEIDRAAADQRVSDRKGHFFPAELLASQFAALEPPTDDEAPIRVDATQPVVEIVARIREALGL